MSLPYVMSHYMLCYFILCYLRLLCNIMPDVMLRYDVIPYVMQYSGMSRHRRVTLLLYFVLCETFHYVTLHYAMLRYTLLC